MAITFACPCGKLLKARPEFAGHRTRCPRCHTVLVIPHADEGVGSASETELLAPMDFGEVDRLIRPGMIPPPEPPPLEAFASPVAPAAPETPEAPPADARPEVLSWTPPPEDHPLKAEPATPPSGRAGAGRPRERWIAMFLTIDAYLCISFGFVQLVAVILAVATRQAGVSPWMILVSVGVLLAAGTLGGLALLAVAVARGLRAGRTSSEKDGPHEAVVDRPRAGGAEPDGGGTQDGR